MPLFFFYIKGGIFIRTKIIFSFDDLKNIVLSNTTEKSFYLLLDEPFFQEIENHQMITREIFSELQQVILPMNIVKHISFKTKDRYNTKQIYELVQILKQTSNILVTFFNEKTRVCNILFISNKEDYLLKQHIKEFLDLEVM